jgi:hypothetical protein
MPDPGTSGAGAIEIRTLVISGTGNPLSPDAKTLRKALKMWSWT